jgi:hypothetical protein
MSNDALIPKDRASEQIDGFVFKEDPIFKIDTLAQPTLSRWKTNLEKRSCRMI